MSGDVLYRLFAEPRASAEAWPWDVALGRYSLILGYTALGDLFVQDPSTGEIAILFTFRAWLSSSRYDDVREFETEFLSNDGVVREVLREEFVRRVAALAGPLGEEQVYIPVPYPVIGGSGAAETHEPGNLWVFLSLVGQTLGVGQEQPS